MFKGKFYAQNGTRVSTKNSIKTVYNARFLFIMLLYNYFKCMFLPRAERSTTKNNQYLDVMLRENYLLFLLGKPAFMLVRHRNY